MVVRQTRSSWFLVFFVVSSFCILTAAAAIDNDKHLRGTHQRQLEAETTADTGLDTLQMMVEQDNEVASLPLALVTSAFPGVASSQTSQLFPEYVSNSPEILLFGPLAPLILFLLTIMCA